MTTSVVELEITFKVTAEDAPLPPVASPFVSATRSVLPTWA